MLFPYKDKKKGLGKSLTTLNVPSPPVIIIIVVPLVSGEKKVLIGIQV